MTWTLPRLDEGDHPFWRGEDRSPSGTSRRKEDFQVRRASDPSVPSGSFRVRLDLFVSLSNSTYTPFNSRRIILWIRGSLDDKGERPDGAHTNNSV